jgi:Ca2+-binding EF-hand superfamily protein
MSSQELGSVLKAVGRPYSPQRVQEAMDIITGRSNSYSISFEEFATLLESDLMDDRDKRLLERFKLFDVDGSGEISLEELKICIRSLDSLVTSAEINDMLKRADTSGDGQVSYKEFYELFHTLKPHASEASL